MIKYEKGTFAIIPNLHALNGEDPIVQTVWLRLCKYADDDGICYPSTITLAKDCGCTQKTVIDRIRKLEEKGLLKKYKKRSKEGKFFNSVYQIIIVGDLPAVSLTVGEIPTVFDAVPTVSDDLSQLYDVQRNSTNITLPVKTLPTLSSAASKNEAPLDSEQGMSQHQVSDVAKRPTRVKGKDTYTPEFEQFRENYPRNIGKRKASTIYEKATKEVSPALVNSKAKEYAELCQANGTEEQYIKHPTTWLNQYGREDEYKIPDQSMTKEEFEEYKKTKKPYATFTPLTNTSDGNDLLKPQDLPRKTSARVGDAG